MSQGAVEATMQAQALQLVLDMLSSEPGAILYRGEQKWEALLPSASGEVLTLDANLMPSWQQPT